MEKVKKDSIYSSVQVKKSTLARIRAIVDGQNKSDQTAKPMTLTWLINAALEKSLTEFDLENREASEKDGEK